jgi:ribonuclease HIII
MTRPSSFSFKLTEAQQQALVAHLRAGNYIPFEVPHTRLAVRGRECTIALYTSGKCVAQGAGAEEWVTFVLEPEILQAVVTGYQEVLDPETLTPHLGIDESGKGDFFGPLVIAAAYADEGLVATFRELNVRDSKRITSDQAAEALAREIRKALGDRFALVTIGPAAYNRLYAKMRNVNRMLAWGHARAIEDLLTRVPNCPRAVSDQFGPVRQIEQALMKKGRRIKLVQRPRAESDPAVAAASILARAGFLAALRKMREEYAMIVPKGASAAVRETAVQLVRQRGPGVLVQAAKCHFKTTDQVLAAAGHDRSELGPDGQAVSKPYERRPAGGKPAPGKETP